MRKIYTLFFLAITLTTFTVNAQHIKVHLSEFFKIKNCKGFLIPIKGDSTGYYALTCDTFDVYKGIATTDYVTTHKLHKKAFSKKFLLGESQDISLDEIFSNLKPKEIPKQKLYLVKFDTAMKFLWKKEISYKSDCYLVNIIPTDDKLYFFFKSWNKAKKASALYYTFLKIRNSLNSKYKQIDTIALKNKNWEEGSFKVVSNENNSRIVTYNLLPDGNYTKGIYNITMFDEEMKMLWKKTINFHFPGKFYSFKSVLINNDKVFFLTKVKKKYKELYSYAIYIVGRDFNDNKIIYLPMTDQKVISGLDMKFDKDGNIMLTGFYDHGSFENPDGLFTATINTENLSLNEINYHDFSSHDISQNGEKDFKGLHFRNFYLNKDGSQTIIAEYYDLLKKDKPLKFDKTGNYPYQNTRKCYLHFGDIVVFNIDNQSEVNWLHNIPKNQLSGSIVEASYADFCLNDTLYLFYNDNNSLEENTSASLTGNAVCHTIALDGKSKETQIINSENMGVTFMPKLHFYKHEKQLLFFLYTEKQYRFAKVSL